jgi:DNA-binding transcriptional regulator LsrR (DeoR family)
MARTRNKVDFRLLAKISKLYYEDHLTQDEIVARLKLSRSTVSRLLAQARQEGIVRIVVVPPTGTYTVLEAAIETKYAVDEVVVTEVAEPESPQVIARGLGAAAANYLYRVLDERDVVGVSWGYTLRGMVAALEPKEYPEVRIIQMTGGIGRPESESYATELCYKMARTLSCKLALLPAPGVVQNAQTRAVYLMDEHVRTAIHLLPEITLAFVGIGSLNSYSISVRDESILTRADLDEVMSRGSVGDIALRFIDAEGCLVETDLNERIIGIDLAGLRRIPRVVGVAGGTNKVEAIRAALRGKLIEVLITDQITAAALAHS